MRDVDDQRPPDGNSAMVRGPEGTPVRGSVRQVVVSRRVLSEG